MNFEVDDLQVIELDMMDKRKYYPLTFASGMTIRTLLYPVTLVKTRLQIQKGHTIYKGTFDAFVKIARNEGLSGLYRGFWVSCLQLFPSMAYISTYEGTRHYLMKNTSVTNSKTRSFIAGGSASVVGQTLSVPLDIITQHLMLMGRRKTGSSDISSEKVQKKLSSLQKLEISDEAKKRRFGAVSAVIREVYKRNGLLGFYKGYFVSLTVFAPNSALWWFFYDSYSDMLASIAPAFVPRLVLQVVSGPLSGISAAVITNPLDLIRARMQVDGTSFSNTVKILWQEERFWIVTKGLTARLVQSVMFSFFIILGYETIKRWSLLDEYKQQVRW
ncbi:solute carrier family 25 member 44-like [Haliotis asinina]|uniref:solute carrier family 25 member 44-like n=1 Tax=Haliotis asinina TaxID=109174 RepID=UPI00353212C4